MSGHNVKLAGHFQNLVGQCPMADCCFQHCWYTNFLHLIPQFAEARRTHQIEQLTKDRKQQHSSQMIEWKKRFIEKQNEATRRAHEDSVKHLQVECSLSWRKWRRNKYLASTILVWNVSRLLSLPHRRRGRERRLNSERYNVVRWRHVLT